MAAVFTLPRTGNSLSTPVGAIASAPKPGLLRRFIAAFIQARQRKADREVAEILARRGGTIGDTPEWARPARRYPGGLPG